MLVEPYRKRFDAAMNGSGFHGDRRRGGLVLHIRRLNGVLHVEVARGEYCPLIDEIRRPGSGRPLIERIVAEYSEILVCYLVEEIEKDRRRRAAAI
jgi:hypothetical protein